jgi:hypothetical protein
LSGVFKIFRFLNEFWFLNKFTENVTSRHKNDPLRIFVEYENVFRFLFLTNKCLGKCLDPFARWQASFSQINVSRSGLFLKRLSDTLSNWFSLKSSAKSLGKCWNISSGSWLKLFLDKLSCIIRGAEWTGNLVNAFLEKSRNFSFAKFWKSWYGNLDKLLKLRLTLSRFGLWSKKPEGIGRDSTWKNSIKVLIFYFLN